MFKDDFTFVAFIMRMTFRLMFTAVTSCCIVMAAHAATLSTQAGAPEGFEQLEAPQLVIVTLYHGGELLGPFSAHMTPSTLSFDRPNDVLKDIAISEGSNQTVSDVLGKPMATHSDLLCTAKRTEDCGMFEPETAGVIFDENHLSAELFINRKYLALSDQAGTRYLPLPDRHFSSVSNINGAISGTDQMAPVFALGHNTTYSYGEAQLTSASTLSNRGLRFDTMTAGVDRNGWNGTAGLFRSNSMQLLSDRDIAGVSVSTSRRTLLDSRKTEGNDIIIYLPRRSFVSLYRDGRLYSSHSYESGNQHIDTSELPEGAYMVTLKIQEADGQVREETRFFAKAQNIPPPGSPTYYAQAGFIRRPAGSDSTMPEVTQHPLVRLGTVQRIDDNLGLSVSFLGLQDRGAVEPGLFWITEHSQTHATLMASTRNDRGVQASYIYSRDKFALSSDFRRIWMSAKPMPGESDSVVRDLTQASAALVYTPDPSLTFGIRASYSKQSGMLSTTSLGPYAEWRIWQQAENILSITADAARTAGQNQASTFLHFSHRFGNYGITGAVGSTHGKDGSSPSGNVHVWHDDPTPGDALLVAAGIDADKQNKTVSGDAHWRNNVGQFEGGVQKSFGVSSTMSYGGNFALNVAQLAGAIHIGGNQNEKAAVVIETEGDADTDMKIYVNNTQYSTIRVGDQRVVYLTPFHKYNIRLATKKGGLFDYESSDKPVVLYPGNVTKLNWKINKFYVVVAHITTPDGQPLANAMLQKSRTQISTDNQGKVQAELAHPNTLEFVTADQGKCQVQTPSDVKPVRGVMMFKEPLVCTPVTQTASE